MTVTVATGNAGKVREIAAALADLDWELRPLQGVPMPEETGATYEENAALKACTVALVTRTAALADDSGIEVEALNGEPGIYSARFGGLGSDLERNLYLLEKLRGHANRRAKFVSVVILAQPSGQVETYRGELSGTLLEAPRGEGGFGYDPLFVPDGQTRTLAEMSVAEKQAISHRGKALAALKTAKRGN
ncbi:RdgB/HAM1 family non-canonical purine NTP pyrophosphatase [Deinococcus frigens]|uniref:RdgB/HAM1 family non-canonical purine NTP pyrophosphatase n=1 Tax=Deinococcus frigens TaxID=249403 RepID=UPI0004973DB0|nr:RdgB/HAM1 family non-canonical purine NTP pyrophosphatase [Deinococcus frigens]